MDKHITDLVEAIEISKGDFTAVAAEYTNNGFAPGGENHDVALDIAMQELNKAHTQFDSLWNAQPLRMEAGITMNEFLARLSCWRVANRKCSKNLQDMMGRYLEVFRSLYGFEEHDSALGTTMRRLERAHWYFEETCKDAMHPLNRMIAGLGVGFNANAVQPPVHPPAAEPVMDNVFEEHNMAAIPEPEEMVEGNSNTSASEETMEDN